MQNLWTMMLLLLMLLLLTSSRAVQVLLIPSFLDYVRTTHVRTLICNFCSLWRGEPNRQPECCHCIVLLLRISLLQQLLLSCHCWLCPISQPSYCCSCPPLCSLSLVTLDVVLSLWRAPSLPLVVVLVVFFAWFVIVVLSFTWFVIVIPSFTWCVNIVLSFAWCVTAAAVLLIAQLVIIVLSFAVWLVAAITATFVSIVRG